MNTAYALLLAFLLISPDGEIQEETIHVISRHFDDAPECSAFISNWGEIIRDRGTQKVNDLLKDGYSVELQKIGCTQR